MNYAPGSENIVGLVAQADIDEKVVIRGLIVRVHPDTEIRDENGNITNDISYLHDYFENIRFYINNQLVDNEDSFVGMDIENAYVKFPPPFELWDDSQLKFVMGITDEATDDSMLKLSLDAQDLLNPEFYNGNPIPATNLTGVAIGNEINIEESVLDISRTDTIPDGEVIIAGTDDVTALEFMLDNNNGGDVDVQEVSIQATATGNATTFSHFTMVLFIDGIQRGSAKVPNSLGQVTFEDLSIVIPSAGQEEISLLMNTVEASAPGTIQFNINDVAAQNIENGSTTPVSNGVTALSLNNPLTGASLELISE